MEAGGSLLQRVVVEGTSTAQLAPDAVWCDPAARHASQSLVVSRLVVSHVAWFARDHCSRPSAPGEASRIPVEPLVSLRGCFQLDSEGLLVELRQYFPPSRIPRYWETCMREDFPRILKIVQELRTSTLNERTRSCISP